MVRNLAVNMMRLDSKSYQEINLGTPFSEQIQRYVKTYDSIRYDLKVTLDISDENLEKLFSLNNPDALASKLLKKDGVQSWWTGRDLNPEPSLSEKENPKRGQSLRAMKIGVSALRFCSGLIFQLA